MNRDEMSGARFRELANRSYMNNQFLFTPFLSLSEQSELMLAIRELPKASCILWGGAESSERKMARFGNADEFGYDEDFPIAILKASPLSEKFSDQLTHRDWLGALMSLGIERSVLGDILMDGNSAYLICQDQMADYIIENLISVKHTNVSLSVVETLPRLESDAGRPMDIQVSHERLDAVISKVFNLSRSDSMKLISQQKVFVNGILTENNSKTLREGDLCTVRGFGRFSIETFMGTSRKGKLNLNVTVWGR